LPNKPVPLFKLHTWLIRLLHSFIKINPQSTSVQNKLQSSLFSSVFTPDLFQNGARHPWSVFKSDFIYLNSKIVQFIYAYAIQIFKTP